MSHRASGWGYPASIPAPTSPHTAPPYGSPSPFRIASSKSAFNSGAERCRKEGHAHLSRASDPNRISPTTSSAKFSQSMTRLSMLPGFASQWNIFTPRRPSMRTASPTSEARPRCGEGLEYLATELVHLYRAGTNGGPVQQSYTLTGSASIGPPKGKHQGKGPEPKTRTPPQPPQPGRPGHGTRGTPPQATRQRDRGGRARKGGGGGTHHQQTAARGGRGTTPRPHSRDGRGATTHSPHTHTEPPNGAQKGEDRHPNSPPTHRTHTRACTQHTQPQLPPTRAPQTHTTHQSASSARTTNTRNTRKPKEQEPSNPAPGELHGHQKHR